MKERGDQECVSLPFIVKTLEQVVFNQASSFLSQNNQLLTNQVSKVDTQLTPPPPWLLLLRLKSHATLKLYIMFLCFSRSEKYIA